MLHVVAVAYNGGYEVIKQITQHLSEFLNNKQNAKLVISF